MTRTATLSALALALCLTAACGGDDTAEPRTGATAGTPTSAGTPNEEPTASADGVVEILATARLKFTPDELTAAVGQEVKVRLVQRGDIPHNLELEDFGVSAKDTMVDKAGDAKEFSFTPDKTGTFTFVCTIHPSTMKGTLVVS